jgi:hypothetical protein
MGANIDPALSFSSSQLDQLQQLQTEQTARTQESAAARAQDAKQLQAQGQLSQVTGKKRKRDSLVDKKEKIQKAVKSQTGKKETNKPQAQKHAKQLAQANPKLQREGEREGQAGNKLMDLFSALEKRAGERTGKKDVVSEGDIKEIIDSVYSDLKESGELEESKDDLLAFLERSTTGELQKTLDGMIKQRSIEKVRPHAETYAAKLGKSEGDLEKYFQGLVDNPRNAGQIYNEMRTQYSGDFQKVKQFAEFHNACVREELKNRNIWPGRMLRVIQSSQALRAALQVPDEVNTRF